MAVAVAQALENRKHLVVEAGTGVGKSLAYLIPAILFAVANSKKAVISTHTINLQEQLTQKDLPMLEQVLPVQVQLHDAERARQLSLHPPACTRPCSRPSSLFTSPEAEELKRIHEWSKTTKDGSLSDFEIEPDPKVWSQVCSERGLCSPKICGHQSEFGQAERRLLFPARPPAHSLRRRAGAESHACFSRCSAASKRKMEGGILFKNDFVIFDEAHRWRAWPPGTSA